MYYYLELLVEQGRRRMYSGRAWMVGESEDRRNPCKRNKKNPN
jgi:hypothetical protein